LVSNTIDPPARGMTYHECRALGCTEHPEAARL
jgi:hypothetical protein